MSILNNMKIRAIFVACAVVFYFTGDSTAKKIVCYYNNFNTGATESCTQVINKLEKALKMCTHLIYCYANIDHSYKVAFHEHPTSAHSYQCAKEVKGRFPTLKIMVSIGGKNDNYTYYKQMFRQASSRHTFINSAVNLLKQHGFDGVDLAIPFNQTVEDHNHFRVVVYRLQGRSHENKIVSKKKFFSDFLREIKNVLLRQHKLLSITVLPRVNFSHHMDVGETAAQVDFVNLLAFDFNTPESSPWTANYPSALFQAPKSYQNLNGDWLISYWLKKGVPSDKLIFGISTHIRAWKVSSNQTDGTPPAPADGAAKEDYGPFQAACSRFAKSPTDKTELSKVRDWSMRFGTYAYQQPKENSPGIWMAFEDADMACAKANYAHIKGLGGVAIFDITHDDFDAVCGEGHFPILNRVFITLRSTP